MTGIGLPAAGDHGGDVVAVAASLGLGPDSMLDLSASMNPYAPDVRTLAADHLDALRRYPDARSASAALADAIGVPTDRLILTNGGAEGIALVAGVEGRGEVVDPDFSLYRRHLATVEPGAPRWRSNPSNPLGRLAPGDAKARVWDEAFWPLATGTWTRGDEEAVRIGSLTKLWWCPGLRLGYVIAPDARYAETIRGREPRWSVNGLALALLPALLERTDLPGWASAIAAARRAFAGELRSLGFLVDDTDAPWVLVHRAGLRDALAPHGVLVRDCASFGLPGVVRVALPPPDRAADALAAFARVDPH